ncbi:hypothetical protein CRYUN_Cryun15aG0122500 [Craigia yunnanensis]
MITACFPCTLQKDSSESFPPRMVLQITKEDGLQHVNLEMEAKATAPFQSDRFQAEADGRGLSQPAQPANKGSYSQVGFSYDGNGKEEVHFSDADEEDEEEEEEDDDEFNSDDSNDEGIDIIAKEFGVKRYGWLVCMDKKAKEEEKDSRK